MEQDVKTGMLISRYVYIYLSVSLHKLGIPQTEWKGKGILCNKWICSNLGNSKD